MYALHDCVETANTPLYTVYTVELILKIQQSVFIPAYIVSCAFTSLNKYSSYSLSKY